MAKLIICRGIPGSGKSYWAAQQHDCIVVTRDDIRAEYGCTGAGWSKEKEMAFVVPEMNARIRNGLRDGRIVISADTNLNPIVLRSLQALADKWGAESEVKDFNTPVEICIERDAQREAPRKVGEVKIREYHAMYMQILASEGK